MADYGRNFGFRVPPEGANRKGRFILASTGLITDTTKLALGAPVKLDGSVDETVLHTNANAVKLAIGAQAPAIGTTGILVYEYGPAAFAGDDPFLTTYSDKDVAPVGSMVQVVSSPDVKVVFKNTAVRTFLNTRTYPARTMVAGIGIATPTIAVGDFLTPGTGSDAAGYWAETGSASNAWLVVTSVDNARAEVEAQMLF